MEKYVYLVTPDYMLPVIEESKLYSFYVKAYPNERVGYKNLVKTNLSSILGFIFFYEELPEDLTYLVRFINFLNLIGDKEVLVLLAVNDPDGVKDFLIPKLETDNITFKFITGFEVVTDSFIKKSLLGTVVLHNFEPYIENINPVRDITSHNSNEPLIPILPSDILSILSPVISLGNSYNTIKHDIVMNSVKDNGLVMYMRINYIKSILGEEIDVNGMIKRINSIDGLNRIVYYSIVNTIKKIYDRANMKSTEKDDVTLYNTEIDVSLELNNEYSPIEPKEVEVDGDQQILVVSEVDDLKLTDDLVDVVEDNNDLFDYESSFNYDKADDLVIYKDEDDLSDLG